MSLLTVIVISAVCLLVAYFTYGSLLSRLLQLDPDRPTPAVEMRDGLDYVPIEPKFLLSQHFSAIAAAGPIVGPIAAGLMFGWLPALLWILLGSILIGGVHDLTALVASIRHKARSIAEVVRDHMTQRSYLLFLCFVWLALVYIIVAFTDITAANFVGLQRLDTESTVQASQTASTGPSPQALPPSQGTVVRGAGIATSSLLYLAIPVVMGVLLHYTRMSVNAATAIFLPLVALAIWIGQYIPLDIAALTGKTDAEAQKYWSVALLVYCFIASIVPMWILLQPRGHLGGYFLYFALGGGMLGLILSGDSIRYPAFTDWKTPKGDTLFPMLFITIACGACSGFHSIIASGTTSKQLRKETDARAIGYGAMLLEAMVAVVSLCCVMRLAAGSSAVKDAQPNFLYAQGIGSFLNVLGVPLAFGVSFGLMAFTTFVYDTLDVCTRLGRYILQELTGWHNRAGRWFATALTAGAPLFFLFQNTVDAAGKPQPVWRTYWNLFGASNQLLAALTLLGVTVWLWRTRGAAWVWYVTGLPMAWMYTMSMWALFLMIRGDIKGDGLSLEPSSWLAAMSSLSSVGWVAIVLVALAALMLVEAIRVFIGSVPRPPAEGQPIPISAT